MAPFRFSVLAPPAPTVAAWRDRARAAEASGYSVLYVTDHLDGGWGPLVAATIAAEATVTIGIGTLVLNNDMRNPVVLAKEIATLASAAEGRVEVGFGAGWLRRDYDAAGIAFDRPGTRVQRLAEGLGIMRALWRGEEVTVRGAHYDVRGARCHPFPAIAPRVVVGGGSPKVLAVAAREADIVGFTRSQPSGDVPEDPTAGATADHYDRCLGWVREAAGDRFGALELQIAAFAVRVVGNRRAAVRTATMLGLGGEEALDYPVVLVGTVEELCERLQERRERWGFSTVVVPGEALDTFAPVVARLAGT